MDLMSEHAGIRTKEDLEAFISALREDLKTNPDSWENADLGSFLEAMEAWVGAMEAYYKNNGMAFPNPPTWKVFGDILMGARIYE